MDRDYPVHYEVRRPERYTRVMLAARVVALVALGLLSMSFGLVFAFAFLVLPVYATARIQAAGSGAVYLAQDGPRVLSLLRWIAAAGAWLGLVAEQLPGQAAEEVVLLRVDDGAQPSVPNALKRVLLGIPSGLVLALLAWIGGLVWIWAGVSILLDEHVGNAPFNYLAGLQRWAMRLLCYQASLVDPYPPFALD